MEVNTTDNFTEQDVDMQKLQESVRLPSQKVKVHDKQTCTKTVSCEARNINSTIKTFDFLYIWLTMYLII